MELWQDMMCNLLAYKKVEICFPQIPDMKKMFEMKCCETLCSIKEILENSSLDDKSCFEKNEEIVRAFEKMGSNCDTRHNF